jgi:hypothetical protein
VKLSAKQVVASVAGAVLAALALSFLGAGGTIVGVALGSAAATIGSAVAFHSIDRGQHHVRRLLSQSRQTPPPSGPAPPPAAGLRLGEPGDQVSPDGPPITAQPAAPQPALTTAPSDVPGRRWSLVAAISLVFALSLGVVTVVELAIGESFSDVVGQRDSAAKTSIGGLFVGTTTSTSTTTAASSTTRPTTSTTGRVTTTTRASTTTSATSTSTTTTSTTTTQP